LYYKVYLHEANGFFLERHFPIKDKDIVLVSTSETDEPAKAMGWLRGDAGVY